MQRKGIYIQFKHTNLLININCKFLEHSPSPVFLSTSPTIPHREKKIYWKLKRNPSHYDSKSVNSHCSTALLLFIFTSHFNSFPEDTCRGFTLLTSFLSRVTITRHTLENAPTVPLRGRSLKRIYRDAILNRRQCNADTLEGKKPTTAFVISLINDRFYPGTRYRAWDDTLRQG